MVHWLLSRVRERLGLEKTCAPGQDPPDNLVRRPRTRPWMKKPAATWQLASSGTICSQNLALLNRNGCACNTRYATPAVIISSPQRPPRPLEMRCACSHLNASACATYSPTCQDRCHLRMTIEQTQAPVSGDDPHQQPTSAPQRFARRRGHKATCRMISSPVVMDQNSTVFSSCNKKNQKQPEFRIAPRRNKHGS